MGRTGTLIALDVLLRQLECEGLVGPFGYVKKMRESRPLMVQTEVRGFPGPGGRAGRAGRGSGGRPPPRPALSPGPVRLPAPVHPSVSATVSHSAGSGGGHLRERADGECSCYRGLSCGRAETPALLDTDSAPLLQPRCLGPGTAEGWGPRPPGPEGREGTGSLDSYFLERGRAQILDFQFLEEGEGWGSRSLLVFV